MNNQRDVIEIVHEMLREQLCCLGRIVARHEVPDDVVWEITKGFDVIYQRTCLRMNVSSEKSESRFSVCQTKPHPGLTYLLDKLNREIRNQTRKIE